MMNYEVNPFQDYESITVDELKDQANSLLNLVTEEQRPLRVCMNNGKEFLLFPQDLLAPICDSDFRLILLSAMRYAMGRNTCMPMVVADYIKRHIQLLDDKFLVLAADEIRRHLEDYAEHEPNPNLWHDLLDELFIYYFMQSTQNGKKNFNGKSNIEAIWERYTQLNSIQRFATESVAKQSSTELLDTNIDLKMLYKSKVESMML